MGKKQAIVTGGKMYVKEGEGDLQSRYEVSGFINEYLDNRKGAMLFEEDKTTGSRIQLI